MRILIAGGLKPISAAQSKYLAIQGHEVEVVGADDNGNVLGESQDKLGFVTDLLGACTRNYDIVQINGLTCVNHMFNCGIPPEQVFSELLSKGSKLAFFVYGREILSEVSHLQPYFSQFLLGSPEAFFLSEQSVNWKWCPIPVDLDLVPSPPIRELKDREVKVLHFNSGDDEVSLDVISRGVHALKERGYRFTYSRLDQKDVHSMISFLSAIRECDVFLEQTGRPSYGLTALYALAHGKTVISGNSAYSKRIRDLSLSPVIDSTPMNFMSKLEAVVREPICMRDLTKRGRAYIENFHDAEVLQAEVGKLYASL